MRHRTDLNGRWRFWPDVTGRLATESLDREYVSPKRLEDLLGPSRSIAVPGPWQAQFEDLRLWWGTAWYERSFRTDPNWRGRRVRICFEAVDYFCTVWINGRPAGSHEGGYLPFDFDITDLLLRDDNSVMVEVRDPGREQSTGSAAPFRFDEVPHGKQSWYGPTGGLWQGAFLEATGPSFIRSAQVSAGLSGHVRVDARLHAPLESGGNLSCEVVDRGGHVAGRVENELQGSSSSSHLELEIEHPQLWDTHNPNLYEIRLRLNDAATLIDRWSAHFGCREISVEDGRIILNDRPIILRGALDQDYYPDTICTPPSEQFLRSEIQLAKEMGLNLLRCHIKVPDPRYLMMADTLGMLVWAELPNWNEFTPEAATRARRTFEGMVERDFNHPSIVIWTLINESWGVDLNDAGQRRWVAQTYEWARKIDPTRLIVDNSACVGNFHITTDVNDFHFYRALPDHQREWDQWTAAWVAEPTGTFSPYGDAVTSGGEPLVLSEFGNWGLPDIDNLLPGPGNEPWWFATGTEWEDGSVTPEGALDRFAAWRLDDVFGSWKGLAAASQQVQFESLKHEILDLRSHHRMSGYVITEFTDVNWECNGLLDLSRNPKGFHQRLGELNAADVLAPKPEPRRYWSGDVVRIDSLLSHFSPGELQDCVLECGGAGIKTVDAPIGRVPEHTTSPLPPLSISLPIVTVPEQVELTLRVLSRGRRVATTGLDVAICPPAPHTRSVPEVRVVECLDGVTTTFLRDGGRAVIVATDRDALRDLSELKVRARHGAVWDGDWAQGLHWIRPWLINDARLAPVLTSVWSDLVPQHVIAGIERENALDVLTGYFVGWIHHTVATTVVFRCGRGRGIVTTFPVLQPYGRDPLATWFLNRLTEIAADAELSPRMHI
jgi:glycosyl hydrolase family 2